MREAVAAPRQVGAMIEEADPEITSPASIIRRLFAARAAWTIRELSEERRALMDPAIVVASAREGEQLRAGDYLQAEAERVQLLRALARYRAKYDLLITAASAERAPPVDFDPSAPSDGRPRESYAAL